jgi:uncharacterized protein (DUF697 family)
LKLGTMGGRVEISKTISGATSDGKEKAIREVILTASLETAMLALEPAPLLDIAIFAPIQHQMIQSIARLRGSELDGKSVREAFGMARGSFIVPEVILSVAKVIAFVPGVPDVISGTVGFALATAIGEVFDRYLQSGRKMSPGEVRKSFDALFGNAVKRTYRERRHELKAMFRSSPVGHELRALKREYRKGAMGAEELMRKVTDAFERHKRRS